MLLTDRIAVVVGIDRLPCCLYGRQLSLSLSGARFVHPLPPHRHPTRRRQRLLLALLDEGEEAVADPLTRSHRPPRRNPRFSAPLALERFAERPFLESTNPS